MQLATLCACLSEAPVLFISEYIIVPLVRTPTCACVMDTVTVTVMMTVTVTVTVTITVTISLFKHPKICMCPA
jgi:hypothetical protein